jgi:hypothetical protein
MGKVAYRIAQRGLAVSHLPDVESLSLRLRVSQVGVDPVQQRAGLSPVIGDRVAHLREGRARNAYG